jgi:hypothetical protein
LGFTVVDPALILFSRQLPLMIRLFSLPLSSCQISLPLSLFCGLVLAAWLLHLAPRVLRQIVPLSRLDCIPEQY